MKTDTAVYRHTNHLINQSSPYLLSHAHNPVNWYPWGDEALTKAKELGRPIFLSIGYASCHWCHVMERESFENEEIAGFMNDHYVAIKVDREERPDLDQIYMSFTQALTGSGGWPMSVWLTPDLKPFYAGTYFPPEDKFGRPGFKNILSQIADAWINQHDQILESSHSIFEKLKEHQSARLAVAELNDQLPVRGAETLMRTFDNLYGGFGNDRKFPHTVELSLFLRHYYKTGDISYLKAVEKSLKAMIDGGIHDQIGRGFARYSVDRQWLVPHFEKMLYDNALLVITLADAFQLTGDEVYREGVRTTLDFILREMTDKSGGFYSALDADSEGEEGSFYVWSKEEIDKVLGADASPFCEYFNVSEKGNFEGRNIFRVSANSAEVRGRANRPDWAEYLERCKKKLLAVRSERVRPLTDDKILTSWNGLALAALARGYQITHDERYLAAAIKNAEFVRSTLHHKGDLVHAYREGKTSKGLFLEDYAYYAFGLVELLQVDAHSAHRWVDLAEGLADRAIELFLADDGTFYLRPDDQTDLIMRPKDESDGALPAPGSIMINALLKLHRIGENKAYLIAAEKALKAISGPMTGSPGSFASALLAVGYYFDEKIEVIVVGQNDEREKMLSDIYRRYLPSKLVVISEDGDLDSPLFEGRQSINGELLVYLCRNSSCLLPVATTDELSDQLDAL